MLHKTINIRRLSKLICGGFGFFLGMLSYPVAWFWTQHPKDPLALAVAEILMIGFYGSKTTSPSAKLLAKQLHQGQVKGVFFVNQNIGNITDVKNLMRLFQDKEKNHLIAIDHEGGIVQRLTKQHHMTTIPSAREISKNMGNLSNVRDLYMRAGFELKNLGFNVNLGPVLDVDDPTNDVIGVFGRSFSDNPKIIYSYGKSFIEGFEKAGVTCALKHFPGHGKSIGDSHYEPANISASWSREELMPYEMLIRDNLAPMIMCGHLRLDQHEPTGKPATLSSFIILDLLRKQLGFNGVVITDDLDMGAVSCTHNRRQAVIEAIKAGNDLLMIKNLFGYDPLLPKRALSWVRQAIKNGELNEDWVLAAAERVRKLKQDANISCSR